MKNVLGITVLVLLIVIVFQWQCGGKSTDGNKYKDSLAIVAAQLNEGKVQHNATVASDRRKIDSVVAINTVLESRLKASTADFENEGKKAVEYNRLYKIAKKDRDTLMIFENCDSMSGKVDAAEQKYAIVKTQKDSLSTEIVIAKNTYERSVTNLQTDYDSLQARADRKDELRIRENAANVATIKKDAKKKGFWNFIKGGLIGILLNELKHLFIK